MAEGEPRIWTPPGGSADPRPRGAAEQQPAEISAEELIEQIKRLKISDVLLSTLSTVAQLGFAKLEPESRDLEQARLAIEALRALLPVLASSVPEQAVRDFRQVTTNLQLAYADAAAEAPPQRTEPSGEAPGRDEPEASA